MRILVVEGERHLACIIKRGLIQEGYSVDAAYSTEEDEYRAASHSYDLVIIDVMLPRKSVIAVCQTWRQKKVDIPLLMLTTRDRVEDRVNGSDGVDDYLVKPFPLSDLLAHVQTLLYPEDIMNISKLQVSELIMDTLTREVWRGKRKISLTATEFSILEYFMRHPNIAVTRTMIRENTWDYEFNGKSNIIDSYITRLRKKIDVNDEASLIRTIRRIGYQLKAA